MRRSTKKSISTYLFLLLVIGPPYLLAQPLVDLKPYVSGLIKPVVITHAGDERMFVVEQLGTIKIVDETGTLVTTPFLDLTSKTSKGSEQGLLGLAFHPGYDTNGYFYVNYTDLGGDTRVSRFSVNDTNPQIADPASESLLLWIDQPYANHNAGDIKFGPDGYLYITTGDGGSAGDPKNSGQDSLSLLGKILRIDVNVADTYAIPVTNPFAGMEAARDEVWAFGLRNPWRFSFDRLTGDLWIGDVGQGKYEEIDFQPASSTGGENYGWKCYEGDSLYKSGICADIDRYTFPVYAYSHNSTGGCSVTGGYVYRGSRYPGMYGYYFFSDYCSDRIWSLHDSAGQWIHDYHGQYDGNSFVTFGEDEEGELYVAGLSTGTIYRVVDTTFMLIDTTCTVSAASITVSDTGFTASDSTYIVSDTGYAVRDTSYIVSNTRYAVWDTSFSVGDSTYFVTDTTISIVDTTFIRKDTTYFIRDSIFTQFDTIYTVTDSVLLILDSTCVAGTEVWSYRDTTVLEMDTSFTTTGISYHIVDTSFLIQTTYYSVRDTTYHIIDTLAIFTGDTSTVGLYIPAEVDGVRIYPNPAGEFLEVYSSAADTSLTSLTIRDIYGRLIYQTRFSENPIRLNVEYLRPGIYLIGITVNGKQEVIRFLKN